METNNEELKLSFLLSASCNSLPPSCIKLQSYLNINSSIIAENHGLKLPKFLTSQNMTCPFCYSSWSGYTVKFKLLQLNKKLLKTNEKLHRKNESQIFGNKEINDAKRNILELHCRVCLKKSKFCLEKLKKGKIKDETEQVPSHGSIKKKKKKKDKFCGLVSVYAKNNTTKTKVKEKKKQMSRENTTVNIFNNPLKTPNESTKNLLTSSTSFQPNKSKCTSSHPVESKGKFYINPYGKDSKNVDRKVLNLKLALSSQKEVKKKTLKDFLTLV